METKETYTEEDLRRHRRITALFAGIAGLLAGLYLGFVLGGIKKG